jgi:hypothetical protein
MLDASFLAELAGTYEMAGIDVDVVLREDNVLQLVVLGTANELIPVRGTTFKMKDVTGATIEFLRGPDGKVNRLVRHGGTDLIAPRKK